MTPGAVVVSRCEAYSPADWWHEEDHVVNLDTADGLISLADNWLVPARPHRMPRNAALPGDSPQPTRG